MAWTAPMTFTSGVILTAADLNTHLRDNLLVTEAGLATTANRYFVGNGANSIVERAMGSNFTSGVVNVTGTSYGDTGPSVTLTTGTRALVMWGTHLSHATVDLAAAMSVSVSGATTIAASDQWFLMLDGQTAGQPVKTATFRLFKTLNAGSNTFNCQYRVSSGNANFQRRIIVVFAF